MMPCLSTIRVVVALVWLAMPLWFGSTKVNPNNAKRSGNDGAVAIDPFIRSLLSSANDGDRIQERKVGLDQQRGGKKKTSRTKMAEEQSELFNVHGEALTNKNPKKRKPQSYSEQDNSKLAGTSDTSQDGEISTSTRRGHQRVTGKAAAGRQGRRPVKTTATAPSLNPATVWADNHFLKLGLNPKIEVGIDFLHDNEWKSEEKFTAKEVILPISTTAAAPTSASDVDMCQRWLDCPGDRRLVELARLPQLPSCPCVYSFHIHYEDEVWDRGRRRLFRWRDASGPADRLDTFRPGAHWCIRSLVTGSGSGGGGVMATQQCCYDQRRKLLTRGAGAGTPYVVSPEVSRDLHHKVDIVPWIVCRGDWTRYHTRRKPNNGLTCPVNPKNSVYLKEVQKAKNY